MDVVVEPGRCSVLLAEDDPANAQLVLAILGLASCDVTVVTSGLEATEALEQRWFDLVLMDVNMQGMDGMEATKVIRRTASEAGRARTLIVGLTGRAMPDEVQQCIEAGMDQVIVKPIDVAHLLSLVKSACQCATAAGRSPSGAGGGHAV